MPEIKYDYPELFKASKDGIQKVFKIITRRIEGPILIHCYAGKDRTGMIIALLGLILKVPEKQILADYLSSELDTKLDIMEEFLKFIKDNNNALNEINKIMKKKDSLRN